MAGYVSLTIEDRYKIKELYDRNFSITEIAQALDASYGTIRNELVRGRDRSLPGDAKVYDPVLANSRMKQRGHKKGEICEVRRAERKRWRGLNFSIELPKNFEDGVTQVYELLKGKIVAGEIPYGMKLPTQQFLIAELGVTTVTVRRVYERLYKEGYAISLGNSGSFATYKNGKVTKIKTVKVMKEQA